MTNVVMWDVTPYVLQLLFTLNVRSSLILFTLMMEAIRASETSVVTSQAASKPRIRHSSIYMLFYFPILSCITFKLTSLLSSEFQRSCLLRLRVYYLPVYISHQDRPATDMSHLLSVSLGFPGLS
jgi:hypothetical protein